MTKYTLNYFPLGGRALPARLMFKVAGVEFTDERIPFTEWPNVKTDESRFPLNQVPTLQVDDRVICQSGAIYRFLGNELGFYGQSNLEKVEIDQIYETLVEHLTELGKITYNSTLTDEEKTAKYTEYFNSAAAMKRLSFIAKRLKSHDNGEKFFIGEKLSIADLVFLALDVSLAEKYPTHLDSFPELKALVGRIRAVDAIKTYLEENQ